MEREKQDVYEIITDRIIEGLENGNIAWRKSWKELENPKNFITKKEYKGINTLLLRLNSFKTPYWLTFKQINNLGGKVKKGEHSTIIIYWNIISSTKEIINNEGISEQKKIKIPMLRYYRVFNLEQTEGIKFDYTINQLTSFQKIKKCEEIIENYKTKPKIEYKEQKAYYNPKEDYINLPQAESFSSEEEYYSTLFHEAIHSTGNEKRLNRFEGEYKNHFGDESYSKEELIAEIGSSFLSGISQIEHKTLQNSTAYIQGWLKVLKGDKKLIIFASAKAQKAVDYILNKINIEQE